MIDYSLILATNYADKQWTLNGDSYNGLTWLSNTPKPTQAQLDALWESTQSVYTAKQEATVTAKQTGIAKLSALGLTDAEIKALTGITL
jgi:hypothetical protein